MHCRIFHSFFSDGWSWSDLCKIVTTNFNNKYEGIWRADGYESELWPNFMRVVM